MTIKEIAQLAGVSASTVSKIINEKDNSIHPETRSRVLAIVKKYNYVPYANIKAASSAKTFILGVLRRSDNFHDRLVDGILKTAQARGYNILLFDSANSYDEELKHITALCRSKVDGLIWEPVGVNSMQSGHYLAEYNIPVCYVNTPHVPSACNIDFRKMGYAIAEKMLGYGHRKLACLLDQELLSSQLMVEGVQQCLYDHHIALPDRLCFYSSDENYFQELLEGRYSGVISSSYPTALIFYRKLERIHCHIPADISLCSLRDDRQHEQTFPVISTLEIPYRALGTYTAESIIQNIEKDQPVSPENFSPSYQITQTDTIDVPAASHTRKILVTGSICMDILLTVESLPQAGKATPILHSASFLGGTGANQAVGAARLGCHVSLLGKIGKDSSTCFIYDSLQKEQVITGGVSSVSDKPTGKAYIYASKNSGTATTFLPGANDSLHTWEIQKQEHLFKESDISLISAGIPQDAILEAMKLSRKHGLRTIFRPFALNRLPEEFIPYIDIFVSSRPEASALCPDETDYRKQADRFYTMGIQTVIITLGREGTYLKTPDREVLYPPVPAASTDTARETDAFISALSAYLLMGYPLEKTVRIAQYADSLCTAREGAGTAPVDRIALETYIAGAEPDLLNIDKYEPDFLRKEIDKDK